MEKIKQIERCMKMQCDFCNRKAKCDKEIDKACVDNRRTNRKNN